MYSYDSDGSPWSVFAKQVLWTAVGLFAFYLALRMPVKRLRRLAFPGFAFTIVLLILVLIPGIGTVANGSRGWFVFAGFSMQPSELAKIAFAIWGRTCWPHAGWNAPRCARCSFHWCPPRSSRWH